MKNKSKKSAPVCVFCGASQGAQFNIFTPRFQPFGTACVKCEESLPEGTKVPEKSQSEESHSPFSDPLEYHRSFA